MILLTFSQKITKLRVSLFRQILFYEKSSDRQDFMLNQKILLDFHFKLYKVGKIII